MRCVITGATGMVGGEALSLALSHPEVRSVTTVGRRPTGQSHLKLTEVVHADFIDCGPIAGDLAGKDAVLFCQGVYTGAVSDEEFKRITVDYVVGFAKTFREANPDAVFCLLSGAGADQSEKSRMSFARYKGMAENALQEMQFTRLHLLRPGYIYPVSPPVRTELLLRLVETGLATGAEACAQPRHRVHRPGQSHVGGCAQWHAGIRLPRVGEPGHHAVRQTLPAVTRTAVALSRSLAPNRRGSPA